ncbi:carbohydrate kinase family protein [Saccharolobus shibatae]|uniref:Ribokinase-like protein n=1 Tax=Saccharolobus shibatae TaxID=2286 RepID=A0A8F5BUF2_9CREN|nr:carbohydrate kinase family protein [Saccharolobus shibatae]QXJ31698.1 Ribokinase-like protein [Saccharolobus shibatae]
MIHLAVGRFNIDIIVKLDSIPPIDSSHMTDVLEIMPGGAATNYAVAVTKLGHSAKLLAKVGKNEVVRSLMEKVVELGVGLEYVEELNEKPSATLIFLRNDGTLSMVRRLGASILLTREDVKRCFGLFDVIHFASVSPNVVVRDPYAKLVSYDPGPQVKNIESIDVDILYVNEKEYEMIEDKNIKARFIVIKMGKKGAKIITETEECTVEPIQLEKVVDTTGAGDTFDAAFNVTYSDEKDIIKSLQVASVASGLKVTRIGGISSPTLEEVREYLRKKKPNVICK